MNTGVNVEWFASHFGQELRTLRLLGFFTTQSLITLNNPLKANCEMFIKKYLSALAY